jgi:hypothetical protein
LSIEEKGDRRGKEREKGERGREAKEMEIKHIYRL